MKSAKKTIGRIISFFSRLSIWLLAGALCAVVGPARTAEFTEIPVPKSMIYAGRLVEANLLRSRKVPTIYLVQNSVYFQTSDVVGKVAKTSLAPGRPIRIDQLSEPEVVKVNKPAILKFISGGLKITAEVIPLNSAKQGERVRARNMHSGVIVSGIAMADGTISAGFAQ